MCPDKARLVLDIVSVIGTLASIAGLIASLYVLSKLKLVERSYVAQAILPELCRTWTVHSKNLETAIARKDATSARSELARCKSSIDTASEYLPKPQRAEAIVVSKDIASSIAKGGDAELVEFQRLLPLVIGQLESARNYHQTLAWRSRDG